MKSTKQTLLDSLGQMSATELRRVLAEHLTQQKLGLYWETKESTKDAARKAKRSSVNYGKVLFLAPDGNRLRWINDDASLGNFVRLTDMDMVRARLAAAKPATPT